MDLGVGVHEHLGEDVGHASQLRGRQHTAVTEVALQTYSGGQQTKIHSYPYVQ
jgi:hypothetical protein